MKKQLFYKVGLCLLVFCLVSTGIVAATTGDLPKGSHNKIITESDNGKTIYLKQGDAFSLKLKDNSGSTGYSWDLSLSSGLKQLSDKYYLDPKLKKIPPKLYPIGAGEYRVWKIKAVAKGDQQVTGICKRVWEPVTGNEQTFTLNVRVV